MEFKLINKSFLLQAWRSSCILSVLLLLLSSTSTNALRRLEAAEQQVTNVVDNQIYGGFPVRGDEFNAFALLCYTNFEQDETNCGGCGGALIAPQFVLTAAHCVEGLDHTSRRVHGVRINMGPTPSPSSPPTSSPSPTILHRAGPGHGDPDPPIGGTFIRVIQTSIHPDFVYRNGGLFNYHDLIDVTDLIQLRNDVAVLKLETPVTTVTPLSYNRDSSYPSIVGSSITALGYGQTGDDDDDDDDHRLLLKEDDDDVILPSDRLYRTTLQFQKDKDTDCEVNIADGDETICVTGVGTGVCIGDAGGPLLDIHNLIVGMISFANNKDKDPNGFRCGGDGYGGSKYHDDVKSIIWGVDTWKYATWIDQQIGSPFVPTPGPTPEPTTPNPTSPSPTPIPTPHPTHPPMEPPTPSCFSESSTVQVLVKGTTTTTKHVAMKDLQVGAQIFAGFVAGGGEMMDNQKQPTYETVYGFAHRDKDRVSEYLHITTTTFCINNSDRNDWNWNDTTTTRCTGDDSYYFTSSLDISPDHLIFVQGHKDPVPARSLMVGDILFWQSITTDENDGKSQQQQQQLVRITDIESTLRRGLYAPLTKDGTVIVDGIHASSYVSIRHLVPQVIDVTTQVLGVSEQTVFHWWMAPYRIFCTWVSPQLCMDDYSEDEGYIHWLVVGKNLAEFAQGWFSNSFVITVGLSLVICFCGVFVLLESLLDNPGFWLLQFFCPWLLWKLLSSKKKAHS